MTAAPSIQSVIYRYGEEYRPMYIEFLRGAGGFSGALFWKLTCPAGLFCLRRWPQEHPTLEELRFIHDVLHHAESFVGDEFLPLPLATRRGESIVESKGYLWELTRWMPGKPVDAESCTNEQIAAALRLLALFHLFSHVELPKEFRHAMPSPGILRRQSQLSELVRYGRSQIANAFRFGLFPRLDDTAEKVLRLFSAVAPRVLHELKDAGQVSVPIQPCIRDVWSDHVLFEDDNVTGLIDFGAMKPDYVATDVARLLGSYAEDDSARWEIGLEAYSDFGGADPELVRVFDRSFVAMAGMQWLQWLYVEGRTFEHMDAVAKRLATIARRMERLAGGGDWSTPDTIRQ